MPTAVMPLSTLSSRLTEVRHTREAANCPYDCTSGLRLDAEFVAMLSAYRGSGGLARAQEVLALFNRCGGPSMTTLARWIAEREVICFAWQSQPWLPVFQFDRVHLEPNANLRPIYSELTCVYDQWEMGAWFARPNPWLENRTPVDTLFLDLPAVVSAARADRFTCRG